ncbi:DNA ligase D [Propylenella binzhouense]|uniref:DNA ligase (ATP) n=1 Tax=Propylenella binzhouense TaxID=2555902 RepID=A0A964T4D0_9HYPH|nr:DNA ligase D [Propylenella binzhouense]MYZ48281.1 DNA ligase D [Propylenella binzhouense]
MAEARPPDSLKEYKRKRDFSRTAEPEGRVATGRGFSFVVQKHAARRLHYDFRLELDGVLKSWAVTKGPSLDPGEKRLAVRTEDHPLDYGGFEGTIPKGEYGGGTVMLWDRGTWEPLHDPREGLAEGKLHFVLHGERLKGGWALVRLRPRSGEKRENWLLIKERDETADEVDPLLAQNVTSVATGRSMEEIATGNSAVWRSNRPKDGDDPDAPRPKPRRATKSAKAGAASGLPDFRPPQLATLVAVPPDGRDWVHELKYDGYRVLVAADGTEVRCYTRNGLDWTARFRPVADAFARLGLGGALIDGEVAAFAPDGRTDFSTLQAALKEGRPIAFFAFDLLVEAGEDIAALPLTERKERLRALLAGLPADVPIHYSEHIRGEGQAVLGRICAAGHEGIVSKRADAPYRGERTRSWLKTKCTRRQEFVIGGWTPSDKRRGFRSLLVGTWKDGRLVYAGRVGTGFDGDDLEMLAARFERLGRKDPPFAEVPREVRRKARWVEPELVAEIAFTEFTSDGILRHPSFQGLREDKPAREVRLETPADAPARPGGEGEDTERAGIRITSPNKVLFPGQGVTKADLLDYYEAVGEAMLRYVGGRPLSLVRCPQGRGRKCFFQKHDTGGFPDAMRRVMITENSGETEQYFYVDDLAGLVAGVQMGVLEFHLWGSRIDAIEKPERLVFDLDPDEGLGFADVRRAAFDLRDRLDAIGLATYPMLTGGKGVHVIAPLVRRAGWVETKAFCKRIAEAMAEEEPGRFVAIMSKARRKGRIFVDYLRNERGSTAIGPYSTRAREGAPVAAPVTWDELAGIERGSAFDIRSLLALLLERGDPWPDYFKQKQSLTKTVLRAAGLA